MISVPGKPGSTCGGFGPAKFRAFGLAVACFIAGFFAFYFLVRESQLKIGPVTPAPISYAFDQSFIQHFGPDGVRAMNKLMRRGVLGADDLDRQFRLELAVEQVRYDQKLGN